MAWLLIIFSPYLLCICLAEGIKVAYDTIHDSIHDSIPPKPPKPLRRTRKRALTPPLPEFESSIPRPFRKKQVTYDQSQSPLFGNLPYEIRRLIYELVLAPRDGRELHVGIEGRRVRSTRCWEGGASVAGWDHACWYPEGHMYGNEQFLASIEQGDKESLGLLRCCRRVYFSLSLSSFF